MIGEQREVYESFWEIERFIETVWLPFAPLIFKEGEIEPEKFKKIMDGFTEFASILGRHSGVSAILEFTVFPC